MICIKFELIIDLASKVLIKLLKFHQVTGRQRFFFFFFLKAETKLMGRKCVWKDWVDRGQEKNQKERKIYQHEAPTYSIARASARQDADVVRDEKLLAEDQTLTWRILVDGSASMDPSLHRSIMENNQGIQRSFEREARKQKSN